MYKSLKILTISVLFLVLSVQLSAQKLIQYQSGMGSRDPGNAAVWILYNHVTAQHEGMTLVADSALLDTEVNNLSAFDNVQIFLTDTTTIYGDYLYYDGTKRIVEVWGDTVVLIDGNTTLYTDNLTYDRNTSVATYHNWGRAVNGTRILTSCNGTYNSNNEHFAIYDDVVLENDNNTLLTDTLLYSMRTNVADFVSPTTIFGDSVSVYSELGNYNTSTQYAESYKTSRVTRQNLFMESDTLFYNEKDEHAIAIGNVFIHDTINHLLCYGGYGETTSDSNRNFMVTDSALAIYVESVDSAYLHADTIFASADTTNQLQYIQAYNKAKIYRKDVQTMSDSIYYNAADSSVWLYGSPVLWNESYQATSDTVKVVHDTSGVKLAYFYSNAMVAEMVDVKRYNQIKGRNAIVYFSSGQPSYADVLGSAQMVYYILEEDNMGAKSLMGVNTGVGSSMRIYFHDRAPNRLVTFGNPDMMTYPPNSLPEDKKILLGFKWLGERRPLSPIDVFKW